MSRQKQDQQVQLKQSSSEVDVTRVLPAAVTQNALGLFLPNPDVLSMYQTSRKLKGLFQPRMDALKLLTCVVESNVDALTSLVQENPGLLFKKGEVKAPRGQTYYNVSPYMLMNFLCDEDMIKNIMPLIPNAYQHVRQAQYVELGHGGADLVKLDFDPMLVTNDDFHKLIEFKTNIDVWGTPTDITFPLLENPDGLLYWKDNQDEVNFYYANRETQTVIPLVPVAATLEEQQALEAFKESFDAMENNSARRSTNKEHHLITKLMQRALHRQGIHYSNADGERYCDNHTPFQLINCYRTALRLYLEAQQNTQLNRAHEYWREGVGTAQGEEMWLLQRICEENQPFHLLPQKDQEFRRGYKFDDWSANQVKEIFKEGRLLADLGSDFALYKGNGARAHYVGYKNSGPGKSLSSDLNAVYQHIESAKAKTVGYALEADEVLEVTTPRI